MPRPRVRSTVLLATAATVAAVSLYGSFRAAEVAGRMEVEARSARAALLRVERDAQQAESLLRGEREERLRLERELGSALDSARALGEAVTATLQSQERAAVDEAARRALVERPVPFGVVRCLQALRDCLRADGFPGLSVVRAAELRDHELRDVEVLDADPASGSATLLVAESMTATLHRGSGEVELRFLRGSLRRGGVREDLPAEGHAVRLGPVTGRLWEERLPFLLRVEGVYADEEGQDRPRPARTDAHTRALWLDRFESLLAEAGADTSLRVTGFRELRDGEFLGAHLVGYDRGNLLAMTADCDRLVIEVDPKARIVSLCLRGGTLRRQGTESSIHTEGYRMLLPNLTPERATTIMTGMVVTR